MTCPNMILIEKKLSTDSFVSDDPRVYEPACYEILVGKVYYAFFFYAAPQLSLDKLCITQSYCYFDID